MTFKQKTKRQRRVSPKFFYYEKLQKFREEWLAKGGTRAELRKARKAQHTLYPTFE